MGLYDNESPPTEFTNIWAEVLNSFPNNRMGGDADKRYWSFLKSTPMPIIRKAFQLAGSKGRLPAPEEVLVQCGEARAALKQTIFEGEKTLDKQITDEMNHDQVKINAMRFGWLRQMLAGLGMTASLSSVETMTKQEVLDAVEGGREGFFWSGTDRYRELVKQQMRQDGEFIPSWMEDV